jgi:hypothetical protein
MRFERVEAVPDRACANGACWGDTGRADLRNRMSFPGPFRPIAAAQQYVRSQRKSRHGADIAETALMSPQGSRVAMRPQADLS